MSDKLEDETEHVHAVTIEKFPRKRFGGSPVPLLCVETSSGHNRRAINGVVCSAEDIRNMDPEHGKQMNSFHEMLKRNEKVMMDQVATMETLRTQCEKERQERKEAQKQIVTLQKKCNEGELAISRLGALFEKERQDLQKQVTEMSTNISKLTDYTTELEDMIYTMNEDNIWAQHSAGSGSRAFGRRVSEVVQSAKERKAAREIRERDLLMRQKVRTVRELGKRLRKARELPRK
mmetsp:Transcript_24164/g.52619  ORF Transcript_24164/g.52619 Transcript_24164/m.52619 type:complete len:234 (+) Transcript_24164:1227-1928(+)